MAQSATARRFVTVAPQSGQAVRAGRGELVGTAASRAGDAITFRALRDVVFVLTSCSVDYQPLNNGRCTPLRIEITLNALASARLR
jgi:uncharacterized protein YcgI (DUF1989 family)